jgi:hypothetical protein
MTLLLGRAWGVVGVLIFAPVMGLLWLALKLSGASRILRQQMWRAGARQVRTRCFVTPANAMGQFLRDNHLDHLPALLDIAAGRLRLLVEYGDRAGLRITLAPELGLGQAPGTGIEARRE